MADEHSIDVGPVFEQRGYVVGHEEIDSGFRQSAPEIRQGWCTHDRVADPVGADDQHGLRVC
jgi:hypothetical protein